MIARLATGRRFPSTRVLGFVLSLVVVLALYLAGGWRPYVNVLPGFHYGINSPFDAFNLLLPPGWWTLVQQHLLMLRAAFAGGLCGGRGPRRTLRRPTAPRAALKAKEPAQRAYQIKKDTLLGVFFGRDG